MQGGCLGWAGPFSSLTLPLKLICPASLDARSQSRTRFPPARALQEPEVLCLNLIQCCCWREACAFPFKDPVNAPVCGCCFFTILPTPGLCVPAPESSAGPSPKPQNPRNPRARRRSPRWSAKRKRSGLAARGAPASTGRVHPSRVQGLSSLHSRVGDASPECKALPRARARLCV